ncbi:MAG: helix-turn-helix transcriptional regulator [Bacteroidia bacterium]|nr:helix-turn-helix transcriptional regulator [Bacteroidia bacterium]
MVQDTIPEFKLAGSDLGELPFKVEKVDRNVGYDSQSPHRHTYYEIFLFEEGGGLHMIDFQEFDIRKGDVHLLSPGQIHYMHRKPESSGWVIKFSPAFFLATQNDKETLLKIPFLNSGVAVHRIRPEETDFDYLIDLALRMRNESTLKRTGYRDMIHNYLNLTLTICNRLYASETPNALSAEKILCNRFRALLETHVCEQHRVGFYAGLLGVSDDKLCQAVRTAGGNTPSEMISRRLLLEAKRCLLHSTMSIKEIAYSLNFQDNAYFNRWFKKHENTSPGAFRVASREKYHT